MRRTRPRRSLTHVGGPVRREGERAWADRLAACLEIAPGDELPFTHGFHAYPARMHPETARRAIERFAPPGTRVLDPFVGSGTTALEAVRAGLAFTGADISRVALEIAWARTRIWHPDRIREFERSAERAVRLARKPGDESLPEWARKERDWYPPHTLAEIVRLHDRIAQEREPEFLRMLTAVLSSIVVKLSYQASDSVAAPDSSYRSRPPGSAVRLFGDKAEELTRMLLRLSSDLYKRKVKAIEPVFRREDSRVADFGAADLVLTSPPYPGTYDYVLHHERRLPLYGDPGTLERRAEVGARRDVRERTEGPDRYRGDLAAVLGRLAGSLAPGGRIVMLIGDGTAAGRPVDSAELVRKLAADAGMAIRAAASQSRREWAYDRVASERFEHLVLLERAR